MSLVLAIERDAAQAEILREVLRGRVGAELVVVTSRTAAIAAIKKQVPDLILVTALLSPRDEEALVAHLRSMENATHLQTLTIPQFRKPEAASKKGGFFSRKKTTTPAGCDPAVFADEVATYLARAREVRKEAELLLLATAPEPAPTRAFVTPGAKEKSSGQTDAWNPYKAPAAPDSTAAEPIESNLAPLASPANTSIFADTAPVLDAPTAFADRAASTNALSLSDESAFRLVADEQPVETRVPAQTEGSLATEVDRFIDDLGVGSEFGSATLTLDDFEEQVIDLSAAIEAEAAAQRAADDEARRLADEEARRAEEEAHRAEEQAQRAEEEARRAGEADALRAAEEARREAAELRHAAEEAKREAEETKRQIEIEAARRAEEDARRLAEIEAARRDAQEHARRAAEADAARRAAEERAAKAEARLSADADAVRREAMEEAARLAAEVEAARAAAQAETARLKAEAEAARKAAAEAEARRAAEAEARRRAEEEAQRAAAEAAQRAAEEAERRVAEETARRVAEQTARLAAEDAARRAAEEEARRAAEEARRAAEEEARRAREEARVAAEEAKRAAEAEAKRAAEEARRAAEEEARRAKEEARRAAEEAKRAAEEEARRVKEEARRAAEEEARRAAEAEKKRAAAEAEALRVKEEARRAAEEEAKRAAEAEKKRVAAEAEARKAAEAQAKLAAELERLRRDTEARRVAELAALQKEAETLRQRAIEEARATAEAEARAELEMELARVRSEAQNEIARVQGDAEHTFEQELVHVRAKAEAALAEELARTRAEEEQARQAQLASALQNEVARVRADADARLQAELDRVRREAEFSRATDQAELDRIRREADERLEGEMAQLRAEFERQRAAELEDMRRHVASIREAAAKHARAAAADAVRGETARARETAPGERPRIKIAGSTPSAEEPTQVDAPQQQQPPADYYKLWQQENHAPAPAPLPQKPKPAKKFELPFALDQTTIIRIAAGVVLVVGLAGATRTGIWSKVADIVWAAPEKATRQEAPVAEAPKSAVPVTSPNAGDLVVETTPPGAKVLLEGKNVGLTPVTLKALKPGKYRLVLESEEGTIRRDVSIRKGERFIAQETFMPGWLTVHSRIPVDVMMNGNRIGGSGDGQLLMPPGRHKVGFSNVQYNYSETVSVEIEPGRVLAHNVKLPLGRVNVNAPAGAEIWVEGERVGDAPVEGLRVPIGTREILVKHPSFGERREFVEVLAGRAVDIQVNPSATGRSTGAPKLLPLSRPRAKTGGN
jgi:hypothetical protein